MVLDELAEEEMDTIARCRNAAFKALSKVPPKELAHYFRTGDGNQIRIYMDFLQTQSQEYREEFNKNLSDPLFS